MANTKHASKKSKKSGKSKVKKDEKVVPIETTSVNSCNVETTVNSGNVETATVNTVHVESSTTSSSKTEVDTMNDTLLALSTEFSSVLGRLNDLSSMVTNVKNDLRKLEKHATRELKTSLKKNSKHKRKASNRSPSGFVKPTLISSELAKFLGKEDGCEMARTEVTKELNSYIRANNLQDKQNGRKINADKKLSTLLKLNKNDELTYFNLQKYMSPHFAKNNSKNVVVSTNSL
jgi:upstream activation factor subunit UAF30